MGKLESLESLTRDELFELAKMLDEANYYEEMTVFMRAFIKKDQQELSENEWRMLLRAYQGVFCKRRFSWRALTLRQCKETGHEQAITIYKEKVEDELRSCCCEFLSLLDDMLRTASNAEARVLYLRAKGDWHRYLCEFSIDEQENTSLSLQCYEEASEVSEALEPINATRLSLALNFSVFCYETLKQPEKAHAIAKTAFDEGILSGDTMYLPKDSELNLQLLHDNLKLWNSD